MRTPNHVNHTWLDVVQHEWEHQRRRFTPRQLRQLRQAVKTLPNRPSTIRTAPAYMAMTATELAQRLDDGDEEAGWEIATRHAHHHNRTWQ